MYHQGHEGVSFLLYAPVALLLMTVNPTYSVLAMYGAVIVWLLHSAPDKDMKWKNYKIPVPHRGGRFGITYTSKSIVKHRGITHTVWFAFAVGGLFGLFSAGLIHLYEIAEPALAPVTTPTVSATLITVGFLSLYVSRVTEESVGLIGLAAMSLGFLQLPVVYRPSLIIGFTVFAATFGIVAHIAGDLLTPSGVRPFAVPSPFNAVLPDADTKYSLNLTKAKNKWWNYGLFILGIVALSVVFIYADPIIRDTLTEYIRIAAELSQ